VRNGEKTYKVHNYQCKECGRQFIADSDRAYKGTIAGAKREEYEVSCAGKHCGNLDVPPPCALSCNAFGSEQSVAGMSRRRGSKVREAYGRTFLRMQSIFGLMNKCTERRRLKYGPGTFI